MAHTIEPHIGGASGAATRSFRALKMVRVAFFKSLEVIMIWQERAEQRSALTGLDMRQLKDIGVTRTEAMREARKPFWLP